MLVEFEFDVLKSLWRKVLFCRDDLKYKLHGTDLSKGVLHCFCLWVQI